MFLVGSTYVYMSRDPCAERHVIMWPWRSEICNQSTSLKDMKIQADVSLCRF